MLSEVKDGKPNDYANTSGIPVSTLMNTGVDIIIQIVDTVCMDKGYTLPSQ